MIRTHDFNTAWWGAPAGIIADRELFEQPADEIAAALAPWAWVELRGGDDELPSPRTLAAAGFFHTPM